MILTNRLKVVQKFLHHVKGKPPAGDWLVIDDDGRKLRGLQTLLHHASGSVRRTW